MSQFVYQIVNSITGINNLSYLELGVDSGGTYNKIICKNKNGVDVNPTSPADYKITTDDFFKIIDKDKFWDIIFIDANHVLEYVVRDFNNSLRHLNKPGLIFVHDLYPNNDHEASPNVCGDGYKLLYHLHTVSTGLRFKTFERDFGLTAFFSPEVEAVIPDDVISIPYSNFVNLGIPRYPLQEIIQDCKQHMETR